jgi:hypothetical protein
MAALPASARRVIMSGPLHGGTASQFKESDNEWAFNGMVHA